ncbi:MAG: ATP-binding protein [Polyangiaceae bacterium]
MAAFLDCITPEDRPRFEEGYQQALADPRGGHIDGRLRRPSGEIRHVRIEAFSIQGSDGRVELRGTMLDVTDQLRMREELLHAQKMEAVGRLAAGIAHDFNNVLTVVTGNLELLGDQIGDAAELQDAHRALASAASLTKRLLAFGRRAQLSLRVVEPNELVESMLALMLRLVGDEVRLETELGAGLPTLRVDPIEIERALLNLVVNARDAMPGGGVVRLRTAATHLDGVVHVEFSVEDEGPGIDEAERSRIFEPFYTTRGGVGGTGLGLATVLGTAEQHGGRVRVENRPAGGSVFTIALPAAAASTDEQNQPGESAPKPASRRLELMVIDDEVMIADVTRRMLERRGCLVRVATEPEAAVGIWALHGPTIDLVICDVVMTQMRGPELVQRLAEIGPRPRVLFITGYSDEAVRAELGHPVLGKPFSAAVLWQAISELCGRA